MLGKCWYIGTSEFQYIMIKDMGNVGIDTPEFYQIMIKDIGYVAGHTQDNDERYGKYWQADDENGNVPR